MQYQQPALDLKEFSYVVNKVRSFLLTKGFTEVPSSYDCVRGKLSVMAACEDPKTIKTFEYMGQLQALPQTNQMLLERYLMADLSVEGVFTIGPSYREEPDPTPGRHHLVFPLFDIESWGTLEDLVSFQHELCEYLGFTGPFKTIEYAEAAKLYNVDVLENEHEERLAKDFGPVVNIVNFPNHTSPFWNMKQNDNQSDVPWPLQTAKKTDCIIDGVETFGSAERSVDVNQMRKMFYEISNGEYAETLIKKVGEKRVNEELKEYFEAVRVYNDKLPEYMELYPNSKRDTRFGFGIGIPRLICAMRNHNLIQ